MADKTITGAIVRITATPAGGSPIEIGRATRLDVTETYAVRPIYGLGSMTPQELPILQWAGQLQLGLYAIPSKTNILGQFSKQGTVTELVNRLLFGDGVDIVISRRVKGATDSDVQYVDVASINGCICTQEGIEMQEGNLVMRGGAFLFQQPITYL